MRLITAGRLGIGTTTPISTLQVAGSVANAIFTKTVTYTASASDYTVFCNNSGAITVNLPAASGASGRIYVIKKISGKSNNSTIDPNASETIYGATTKVLTAKYESAMIQSDGTAGMFWQIINRSSFKRQANLLCCIAKKGRAIFKNFPPFFINVCSKS